MGLLGCSMDRSEREEVPESLGEQEIESRADQQGQPGSVYVRQFPQGVQHAVAGHPGGSVPSSPDAARYSGGRESASKSDLTPSAEDSPSKQVVKSVMS